MRRIRGPDTDLSLLEDETGEQLLAMPGTAAGVVLPEGSLVELDAQDRITYALLARPTTVHGLPLDRGSTLTFDDTGVSALGPLASPAQVQGLPLKAGDHVELQPPGICVGVHLRHPLSRPRPGSLGRLDNQILPIDTTLLWDEGAWAVVEE